MVLNSRAVVGENGMIGEYGVVVTGYLGEDTFSPQVNVETQELRDADDRVRDGQELAPAVGELKQAIGIPQANLIRDHGLIGGNGLVDEEGVLDERGVIVENGIVQGR